MTSMKIYLASSWKNETLVMEAAQSLRSGGLEVDAFCDDVNGRFVFHWSEIGDLDKLDAIEFLDYHKSQRAFMEDKKWLDWADACVMILPCGRSAHLEAGYAVGQGKKLVIVGGFVPGEFDVMYGFASALVPSYDWGTVLDILT